MRTPVWLNANKSERLMSFKLLYNYPKKEAKKSQSVLQVRQVHNTTVILQFGFCMIHITLYDYDIH